MILIPSGRRKFCNVRPARYPYTRYLLIYHAAVQKKRNKEGAGLNPLRNRACVYVYIREEKIIIIV